MQLILSSRSFLRFFGLGLTGSPFISRTAAFPRFPYLTVLSAPLGRTIAKSKQDREMLRNEARHL